ncbi:MAG TPA: hypothetical protein VMA76_07350 [Solirubrobacteraceae bacterium]|nr:hypothetical protein [Solirubrobacteraceae bacterium]
MRYAIMLCLVGAGISLAGCGSSSSSTNSSDPGSSGASSSQNTAVSNSKALQFAACMRSHGVPNFPDPTGGKVDLRIQQTPDSTNVNGVSVNGPAFQSAMKVCKSDLPNGGVPTAAQTAKARSQALAMARCMRSHGVPNFPDPQFQTGPNGGVGVRIGGAGINPSSPAFQTAAKECGSIFGGLAPALQKPVG